MTVQVREKEKVNVFYENDVGRGFHKMFQDIQAIFWKQLAIYSNNGNY